MAQTLPAYVPYIILVPAIAGVIQQVFGKRLPRGGDWVALLGMGTALGLSIMTLLAWIGLEPGQYFEGKWTWFELAGGATFQMGMVVDGLTAALLNVVTFVSFLVFLFSTGYMKGDPKYHRFFFWLSFFAVSMLILTLADNLLMLFIGWELVGLCSYKLIGFWSEDLANAEAAKKAFITTRIGDVGMLLGMMILYAATDTLSIEGIFAAVQGGEIGGALLTVAGIGVFLGAVGKSAQFPLHVWLPDAMAGPTPVSALIHAATMVAAGVYLAARMFPIFTPDALNFIAWTGGLTALIGAIIAVTQTDIKKVLAYSTISQLGYMILGVGVGAPWAAMFHLCTHAMFKACLFLGSGSVIHAMHHAQELKDMGGLRAKMPVTFYTFVFATLGLAGIPMLSGFYSKDAILFQALESHNYILFVVGFGAAFLTAFYMTRLVWLCFFGKPKNQEKFDHAHESPWTMTLPLVLLAVFTVGPLWFGFADKFFRTPAYFAALPDVESVRTAYWAPGAEPPEHAHHPWFFNLLAYGLGVAGIGIGIALFRSGKRDQDSQLLPGAVDDLSRHKFYMDEFYTDAVIASAHKVSHQCAWFDSKVVDGTVNVAGIASVILGDVAGDGDNVIVDGAVNLTAETAQGAGAVASAAQTGRVRNYIAAAMGVTAVLVAVFVYRFVIQG